MQGSRRFVRQDSSVARESAILGSCLPDATPLAIAPLTAPEPDEGVQLTMAPVPLPAATEIDVCFAQYYDLSDVVPKEFQDPEAGVFFVNGQRLRQDPQSHHLLLISCGTLPCESRRPSACQKVDSHCAQKVRQPARGCRSPHVQRWRETLSHRSGDEVSVVSDGVQALERAIRRSRRRQQRPVGNRAFQASAGCGGMIASRITRAWRERAAVVDSCFS